MVGVNPGKILNVWIFEVGMIIDDDQLRALGRDVVTVAVHPLLVAPNSVQYGNPSRGRVDQTLTGSQLSHGGKGLRPVTLQGCFGVDARAVGPFAGTGEVRHRRFYDEVVRLSEALNQAEVNAARNVLTASPFLALNLAAYNERTCSFFVNVYDLQRDRSYQALVQSFDESFGYMRGGATGLHWYTLRLQEVGPLVRGSPASDLLGVLFDGLPTWSQITDAIESLDVAALAEGQTGLYALAAQQLTSALASIVDLAADVRRIFGASSDGAVSVASGAAYLEALDTAAAAAIQIAAQMDATITPDTTVAGTMDPRTATEATRLGPELYSHERAVIAFEAHRHARELGTMGVLFGLSDATFRQLIMAGGTSGVDGLESPDVAGSVEHVVQDWEQPQDLEARYGVDFARLCGHNGLDALELLIPGRVIQVPIQRARGAIGASGLPVLGVQAGRDAWGADVALDLDVDEAAGDLRQVRDEEVLTQGVMVLLLDASDGLLRDVSSVPPAGQAAYLARRVESVLARDPRLQRARATVATRSDRLGFEVSATVETVTSAELVVDATLSA